MIKLEIAEPIRARARPQPSAQIHHVGRTKHFSCENFLVKAQESFENREAFPTHAVPTLCPLCT